MRRVEDLEGRIEALSAELSDLLDEYLEVRQRIRELEATTGRAPDGAAPAGPPLDGGGDTAWPAAPDANTDDRATGDGPDGDPRDSGSDGDPFDSTDTGAADGHASQAAVAAAVEAVEVDGETGGGPRSTGERGPDSASEHGSRRSENDIIVG